MITAELTLVEQIELAKELIMNALVEIDDIELQQNPRLEAEYSMKIGYLENNLANAYLKMRRAKRRVELAQAIVNKGRAITESEEHEIGEILEREFQVWKAQVDAAFERALELAQKQGASRVMTPEEAREFKRLYRQICKRLHPDLNPERTLRDETMFAIAKHAYEMGDLETLRSIAEVLDLEREDSPDYSAMVDEELVAELAMLEAQLSVHQQKLKELKAEFPYSERDHLADPEWLAWRGEQLRAQIAECREAEDAYRRRYHELVTASRGEKDGEDEEEAARGEGALDGEIAPDGEGADDEDATRKGATHKGATHEEGSRS